jgi:hypothetical protein
VKVITISDMDKFAVIPLLAYCSTGEAGMTAGGASVDDE